MPLLTPSRALALCLPVLTLMLAAGCAGPRMKRLSDNRYERLNSDQSVDVYVGQLDGAHEELAIIQTEAEPYVDDTVKQRQIDELKDKARKLGGNAIQDVRILPKRIRSFTADERVPFTSFKQGTYEIYFMRATAIRVPEVEPARLDDLRPAKGWAVERLTVPQRLDSVAALPMPGPAPAADAPTTGSSATATP